MMLVSAAANRRGIVAEWIITILLLAIMSSAFATALSWPFATAFFPLLVSGLGSGLLAFKLLKLIIVSASTKPQATEAPANDANGTPTSAQQARVPALRTESRDGENWSQAIASVLIYLLLILLCGTLAATFVFCLFYLRIVARKSFAFSGSYAALLVIAVFVLFEKLLSLPLPAGLLL